MANASIVFDLIGRDRASADFDRVGRAAERSSRSMRLLASAGKVAAGGALLGAGALVKMAKGAAEDQAAQVRLARALHNAAGATRTQVNGVEDWITAQGKALGVADDDLRPALARLAGATKDVGEAQHLASLAMDVSAGTGKSLESVSMALTKAQNGNVAAIGKLGVKVKDAKGKTVDYETAVKRLAALHKGQASAAADTAAGRYNRVRLMLSETGESIGAAVLPPLTDLAEDLMPKAIKAGERFGDWLEENQGQIRATAGELKDNLTPVVEGTASVLKTAAEVVKSMPEPLRGLALQAGAVALAFPRIAAATTGARGALGGFVSGVRDAETRTAALGGALRNVAGMGGMMLMVQGAQKSGTALGGLSTVLGGAALGFGSGGPIGAMIGAVGGLGLLGLQAAFDDTGEAALKAREQLRRSSMVAKDKANFDALTASLDATTGAITRQTKAVLYDRLEKSGAFRQAQALGYSNRELVNILAEGGPKLARFQEQLVKLYQGYDGTNVAGQKAATAALNLDATLGQMVPELGRASAAVRAKSAALGDLSGLYKVMPKSVATKIEARGVEPTYNDVGRVIRQFKLVDGKQIKAVLSAVGLPATSANIEKLKASLKSVEKVPPPKIATGGFGATLRRDLTGLSSQARASSSGISALLGATGNTKPKVANGPFGASFRAQLKTLTEQARSGGTGVGNQMGAGFSAGLGQWLEPLRSQARATVNAAIASARIAGDIRSPSRKTAYLGRMMGEGLAVGIVGTSAKVRAAAGGVTTGAADVAAKVASKANKAAEAAAKKSRERIKQSIEAAQRALEKYRDRLKGFLDFRNSVRDSVMGSLFGDQGADGQLNAGGLLAAAQDRVAKMKAFLANITKLRQGKLDRTLLQQLISRGVDQAGGDAAALVAGGASAIRDLNNQQAALSRYANAIADQASLSQNGMTAAQIRAGMRAADARYAGNRTTYNVYVKTLPGGERAAALEFEKVIIRAERALGRPIKIGGR